MLNQVYDDNANIKAARMPSALVDVPRINEKYETQSYSQIQGRDLKTLKLIENRENNSGLLNINAAFFTTAPAEQAKIPSDPYEEIFKK